MTPSTEMMPALARMRDALCCIRFELAARKSANVLKAEALHRAKYNANQPRVPPENPIGGQWTSGGEGSGSVDVRRMRMAEIS